MHWAATAHRSKRRKWAYCAIHQGWTESEQWLEVGYERSSAYNLQLSLPRDEKEYFGITKTISK